jgi:phenylpropionate dioxygenase-like ring-hydroxylating dioxygenase large terminal subunit
MADLNAKDATHLRTVASLDDWSLPSWIYSDPEFFELECDTLFRRAWQVVCHVNDIPAPGDYFTYRLVNERLVVIRGRDGVVRGFHNVCRHRAARLLDGDQGRCGGRITCPYHSWSYALDGRLIGLPESDQYERFDRTDLSLVPVDTEIFMGFVFVRIEGGGPGIADLMAPVRDELAPYRLDEMKPLGPMRERERPVNWKNAVDNYIDALHVRAAHPGLNSIVGKTYSLEVRGQVSRLCGTAEEMGHAGPSVRAYCKVLPTVEYLPESHRRLWLYYQVFPNVTFNIYPDMVESMVFLPLSATTCMIRDAAYALDDDRREMRAARYLNFRVNRGVNVEDKDLIERVQDGMGSSSYEAGPLGSHEVCLRGLASQMRDLLPVSRLRDRPARGTVAAVNAEMTRR